MKLTRRPNSLRHPNADYSDPGVYFFTLCTQDRLPIFGEITKNVFHGTEYSKIVWEVWKSLPARYPQLSIDIAIIMPDHFHGIIIIHEQPALNSVGAVHEPPLPTSQKPHPQPRRMMTIPLVVGYLKMNTPKRINLLRNTPGVPVWQRNYFDKIIRIDKDYDTLTEYILTKPQRWGMDKD